MSATTGLIIGGLIGGAGAVGSALIQSGAAGSAGQAQLSAAQQEVQLAKQGLQQQIDARTSAITQAQAAAAMTPGEIQSINSILSTRDQSLSASMASLQKMQASVDSMSPATKAAGQNLYNLLTGQSAAILQPLQTQLNLQRQSLVNNLASQMGPGFMTSSAGIQALTTFDNQASMTLNTAQQNAIQTVGAQYGQLQGLTQQGQSAITSGIQSAFNQAQTATGMAEQGYQVGASRELSATLGAMSANPIGFQAPASAQQSVVGTAGLPFGGQTVLGQGIGQAGQGIGQGVSYGSLIAGYGAMNGGVSPTGIAMPPGGGPLNMTGTNTMINSQTLPASLGSGSTGAVINGSVPINSYSGGNFGANIALA
jgi:hypothetical protein